MQFSSPRILVIDNYDSFTYNLVHLLHECGQEATVWRNDKFSIDAVEDFDHILLSPGPGIPEEAGLLMQVIKMYGSRKKILGICLGLQAIAEVYGGKLWNLQRPVHGTATPAIVTDTTESLFQGLPSTLQVGRYHSWAVNPDELPSCLKITATDDKGTIMALAHTEHRVKGVQFHPESVMTEHGKQIILNWLTNER
jgi:anthranilate synthase component 2